MPIGGRRLRHLLGSDAWWPPPTHPGLRCQALIHTAYFVSSASSSSAFFSLTRKSFICTMILFYVSLFSLSLFLISTLLACLLAFFLLFLLFFLALLLLFLVGWVKPRPDSIQLCNTVDTIFRSYSYNFANRCFPFPNVHFVYLRSCRHCLSIRLL